MMNGGEGADDGCFSTDTGGDTSASCDGVGEFW